MAGDDDWEEQLIDQMVEMFKTMGMPISREQIRAMMEQFRGQFDKLGIDPEKLAKGDVKFNIDMSDISKLFQGGANIEDMLKNLGMDVKVDAQPVSVEVPETVDSTTPGELMAVPSSDVYLEGWNMVITLDITLKGDIEEEQLELALVDAGNEIEVMKTTQVHPVARVALPHPCEDVVDWTLNNGILDITLRLIPQASGSSQDDDDDEDDNGSIDIDSSEDSDEEMNSEFDDDDIDNNDDSTPGVSPVSLDLGQDDDDDEDDGGIPIF